MSIDPYFKAFFSTTDPFLKPFHAALNALLEQHFRAIKHGRAKEWDNALQALPNQPAQHIQLDKNCPEIGQASEIEVSIAPILKQFLPWRKGPYNLFGTEIDTEWRSDWKWQRILPHISDLTGRKVLDIGCGNGYHLLRMYAAGAQLALGIDPTRLFLYQFHLLKHFIGDIPVHYLPLRGEHLPPFKCFDSVFSLGVLYHRRSPIEHLTELQSFLRPGGELILETLIIEGDADKTLIPAGRYASMANVWFLPSARALEIWLARTGFINIKTVDINQTSIQEQRATKWMTFHSLNDFLDPNNPDLTVEGLPAPRRAIVIANKAPAG
ncbi:MAG: tRNA 5-methoxyuridine(34)/uridine 5-oxyacetic acid(34) synthase CmoB [Pseudomonadales bacterium]|nr:tRNA 5-methoxyuridine(34)/uridine 5-oxyacetic acid(34) synthase CmoB [Pseudomonadales bacterium]